MATVLAIGMAAALAAGSGAGFADGPTARAETDSVRIAFTLSAATDVAVDVLDARGRVVRHLGAAALGADDPAPPFRKGLAQSILWDRTDDAGKAVPKGTYRARVRLGLGVAFDRSLGWTDVPPLRYDTVCGLAVGPDRSLYVIATSGLPPAAGRTESRLCVVSPDGRYLRTLSPYPADADPKTLRGVDFFKAAPGHLTPRVYDRVCASVLPHVRALARQTMQVTRDGRLVFVNGWATELYRFGPRSLMIMNTDGSIPRARINGPAIVPKGIQAGFPHVALSPDEKTAYVTGLHFGEYVRRPHQVVYRMGLGLDDKSEVFFGRSGERLKGDEGLDRPRGIATDRDGNVYVSDYGNDRIVVLSPAGKLIGEIPIKGPDTLAVHPKTGSVYALSMTGGKTYKLVRIAGLKDRRVTAELDLAPYRGVVNPETHVVYHPVIALDHYGERPVIYLGYPSDWARARVLRIVDSGAALEPGDVSVFAGTSVPGFPYPQGIDRDDHFYFWNCAGRPPIPPPCTRGCSRAAPGRSSPGRCRTSTVTPWARTASCTGRSGTRARHWSAPHATERLCRSALRETRASRTLTSGGSGATTCTSRRRARSGCSTSRRGAVRTPSCR